MHSGKTCSENGELAEVNLNLYDFGHPKKVRLKYLISMTCFSGFPKSFPTPADYEV